MTAKPWTTQDRSRAIAMLKDVGAILTEEIRRNSFMRNRSLRQALAAVASRGIPPTLLEVPSWGMLQFNARKANVSDAISNFSASTPWARSTIETAITYIVCAGSYADGCYQLNSIMEAIEVGNVDSTRRRLRDLMARCIRHQQDMRTIPDAMQVWDEVLLLLDRVVSLLSLPIDRGSLEAVVERGEMPQHTQIQDDSLPPADVSFFPQSASPSAADESESNAALDLARTKYR